MKEKYRAPLDILRERLGLIYPPTDVRTIFEGFSVQRLTTLRVNTLKISTTAFIQEAKKLNVILEAVPWYTEAFILQSPDLRTFTENPLYASGKCYVQSLSSMLPPLVLNPQKNENVLDLCAAPGSKTSQIAMLMQNTGEIVANDSSHTRIYRLKANLENLGVSNTQVLRMVGQGLWHEYPEYFDKTLVDVPCSMEGRIRTNDPKTYEDWSVKKVKELQEIQKFLLKSGVSATKPGGTIVYSTCTLSVEENEAVIDWILKKQKGAVSLEEIEINGIPWAPAIPSTPTKSFHRDISRTKRIHPSASFEGFFIAKLRKH